MKSSITQAINTGMITGHAILHPGSFVTGQVMGNKNQL
jgi:hypothetical protein